MILLFLACQEPGSPPKDSASSGETGETDETRDSRDWDPIEWDDDCDGEDDDGDGEVDEDSYWRHLWFDMDGDGVGGTSVEVCSPEGSVDSHDDCDDTDASIYPGAPESCDDEVDSDCDGGTGDGTLRYYDGDGDGFGDEFQTEACDPGDGYATQGDDCDPLDASVYPGAPELCDGVDQDCDGLSDEEDTDTLGAALHVMDRDGDGFGDVVGYGCDLVPGDPLPGDCDDEDATVSPAGVEVCDERDNDCDGETDEEATDGALRYTDADEDGFGDSADAGEWRCGSPDPDEALTAGDCDDTEDDVNPEATEYCLDGIDSDCDGASGDAACAGDTVDLSDNGAGPALLLTAAGDLDGDGVIDLVLGASATRLTAYAGPWTGGDLHGSTWSWEAGATPAAVGLFDADGDGVSALVVGVPDASAVYLLSDPTTGGLDAPTWWVDGDGDAIGSPVVAGSDVDQDSATDVLIGCATCAPDSSEQGVVSIHTLGSAGSALFDGDVATFTGEEGERLGEASAIVDLDADGFPEVLLSSTTEGLRLWLGPVVGNLDAASSNAEYSLGKTGGDYALSLSVMDDVDGDGRPEVLVIEPNYATSIYQGRVTLYDGTSTGRIEDAWTAVGGSEDVEFGAWALGVGDRVAVGCGLTGVAIFDTAAKGYLTDPDAALSLEDPDATLSGPPAIGDFDADGDEDLIILESGPTANRARLWTDW